MIDLRLGDCLEVMSTLDDNSVDFVFTDPPYAEVDRAYGRWTESDWHTLMHAVVRECRRILKPHGSALFVIQPNYEKLGRLRPWVFDFMGWACREWNVVQDAYWWNHTTLPSAGSARHVGLMRPSVKPCVWMGEPDCYRNQEAVLWTESQRNIANRTSDRMTGRKMYPSGHSVDKGKIRWAALERGGVTPFNLLPIANANSISSAGAHGHGAGTPLELCRWWIRYGCTPDGVVLDPFSGTATAGIAALEEGRRYIGIERDPGYHAIAQSRLLRIQDTLRPAA